MRHCLIICALFLTACSDKTRTVYVAPTVPADLLQPVVVTCPRGDMMARAGVCIIRLDAGLNAANKQIAAIDEILTKATAPAAQ